MAGKIPVAVVGATGSVGQRFVQLLDGHPWFEVVALTGSERSAGQVYGRYCKWILAESMPEWAQDMVLQDSDPQKVNGARVVFSALPSGEARDLEPAFARAGMAVCSNASAFRQEEDVPLLLPEVNPEHAALVTRQRRQRGWSGLIATNPNCTSTGLTVALKALHDAFSVKRGFVVSLQALSGAGYPGVASLDITDNVIPWIGGEEEKVETEPRKMLGSLSGDEVHLAGIALSAHTNRVAVSDGHLVCASVELGIPVSLEQATQALGNYCAPAISRDLPSAPFPPILVRTEDDRPQPKYDRMTGKGMTTVVGRLRNDPLFHIKFAVLSHNTIRGAAGGSIYNAELLVHEGYIQ